MLKVGLTGGIGVGKSTVAKMLRGLGFAVLDADRLSRDLMRGPGEVVEGIRRHFGEVVFDDSGHIDRSKLGRIVFSDPEQRKQLESIVHPAIAVASQHWFETQQASGRQVGVYEAALLVETGRYREMDRLVVVTAALAVRSQRTCQRDQISTEEFELRRSAQASEEEKISLADYVVDNSGSFEDTRRQVQSIAGNLQQEIEQRGSKRR